MKKSRRQQTQARGALGYMFHPRIMAVGAAVFGLALMISLALAASALVSNVLRLGPSNLVLESISLTQVRNFPSSMKVGDKGVARFQIANLGTSLSNVSLKVQLGLDGSLITSASGVNLVFKDPDTGDRRTIALTLVDGKLEGTLKSGWTVPKSYVADAELELTFTQSAPLYAYFVDLWAENDSGATGGGSPTPTPAPGGPQTVNVQAANGDVFTPSAVTVKVGDTVRWTNTDSKPHNVVFSNGGITGTQFLASGQNYQVTFSSAGTYNYVCQFHSGMAAAVTVQP